MKILIVEGDAVSRMILHKSVERFGHGTARIWS